MQALLSDSSTGASAQFQPDAAAKKKPDPLPSTASAAGRVVALSSPASSVTSFDWPLLVVTFHFSVGYGGVTNIAVRLTTELSCIGVVFRREGQTHQRAGDIQKEEGKERRTQSTEERF